MRSIVLVAALLLVFNQQAMSDSGTVASRDASPIKVASSDPSPATEAYFLCQTSPGGTDQSLLLKSENGSPVSMIFSWTTFNDVFKIEEAEGDHYIGLRRNSAHPEVYAAIDFDRATGEFYIANKVSDASRELLVSICEKRIPESECESRIGKTDGADNSDCLYLSGPNACARIKETGMSTAAHYQCRPSDRRF